MKKIIDVILMLALVVASAVVSADNESDVPEQIAEKLQPEESSDDYYFGKWTVMGFNFITDQVTSGWNTMTESVINGWDTMVESILGGADAVGKYFEEQQIDQKVEEAWNILKKGAANQGEIAQEKLDEAYQTVRNWFVQSGETVDQGFASAVDAVAGAAGVAEAQVSAAYRTVEVFMTEHSEKVTESVTDAWNTICQNSGDMNAAAQEQINNAYEVIRNWMENFDKSEIENVEQSLELIESHPEE